MRLFFNYIPYTQIEATNYSDRLLVQKGSFNQIANVHTHAYGEGARSILFEGLLKKGNPTELARLLETIINQDQRERIMKAITNYTMPQSNVIPSNDIIIIKDSATRKLPENKWDTFICHASEDKDRFVRDLAKALISNGLTVWYDEFTMKVGDKLRQRIEHGLANSRYGVVILSPYFFAKEWPQNELDGLDDMERGGQKVILPVWLDIDRDYVVKYSPMLAGRLAAKANSGMKKVVEDLLEVIKPS